MSATATARTPASSAQQLTPDSILQLGLGFWNSRTMLSAVDLGVFTLLAERGPMTCEELRTSLKLHERSARDFFDALVSMGMLERHDGRYANTPQTALFLDRRRPEYVGGLLELCSSRLFRFWDRLTEALHTGEQQNESKGGDDLFAAIYADPKRLEAFLAAMTGLSLGAAAAIARKFPWKDYGSFVDIGCAQGAVPVAIAQAHSHLTGGGFDLPQVGPIFERYVQQHELAKRLRFHAGSFFVDALPKADVLVMGHILHDWNLEEKKLLLRKAFDALPTGGALIVYEALIDDDRRTNTLGLLMSLNMLIETPGGFDFTGADCVGWMKEVGFRSARVERLCGPDSMVIGFK